MRIAILSLLLSACVTSPYKPYGSDPMSGHGGFEDERIGEGMHIVRYYGNVSTSVASLQSNAYRRAREICGERYDVVSSGQRNIGTVPVFEATVKCL